MVTTAVGRSAEKMVAEHLRLTGYQIMDFNWRRKACEIDIIAKKEAVVYFVEVKYRSSNLQGGGFEHITTAKYKQMVFAAQMWTQFNNWDGDYRLLAASVDGASSKIDIIEL